MLSDILFDYQKAVEKGWVCVSSGGVFGALVDAVLFDLTKDEKYNRANTPEQIAWSQEVVSLAKTYVEASGRFTDAFGVIAMQAHSKNGRSYSGQFFTPDNVTDFVGKAAFADLSYSRIGANHFDVLEPTCGTGAMVFGLLRSIELATPDLLANINVVGCELTFEYARAFYANILLNEQCHGNSGVSFTVLNGNTLENELSVLGAVNHRVNKETLDIRDMRFDLVVGNPPFGKISINEQANWLRTAYKKPNFEEKVFVEAGAIKKNVNGEEIFIDLATALLKEDGVMALVIPDGVLSNAKAQPFRKYLMEFHSVRAVVSFPTTLFVKTGTTVKTSLMMLKNCPQDQNGSVFMAQVESIGWDSRGRTIKNELPEVQNALMSFISEQPTGTGSDFALANSKRIDDQAQQASESPQTQESEAAHDVVISSTSEDNVIDVEPISIAFEESNDTLQEEIDELLEQHIPTEGMRPVTPVLLYSF